MCLSIPGKLIEITSQLDDTFRMGKVSFDGVIKEVSLTLVPEARVEDYVMVHVGAAISVVDEEEAETSRCPSCGGNKTERVNWSWKLALWGIMFFSIVFPYTIYRVKCAECKYAWTQKELRGHPLWISAFAILLIAAAFIVFERTFWYVCKINYWNEVCV